jgi:hypothetical protein
LPVHRTRKLIRINDLAHINQKLTMAARARYPWLSSSKAKGDGTMLGRVARVTYMLTVAVMIVAWAMMPSRSSPVEPAHEQVVENWYC